MPIITKLPNIMKDKTMNYEELQFLSKISPDTVARARDERIATCQLKTLEKIANALKVNVCDLFEHTSKK